MPILVRVSSVLLAFALFAPSSYALTVPHGFKKITSAPGVTLYGKRRDFVQVVDPSRGARVRILHGAVLEQGSYVSFTRQSIADWWKEWTAEDKRAFSVVNGQFFDTTDPDIAPLAFSIKSNGVVYEGYGDAREYPNQKRILILDTAKPYITEYDDNPESLLGIAAEDILVGLSPTASKALAKPMPRTFVGVARTGEILLFSSSMASQNTASRALRSFGAEPDQVMMLDGGSSSHLVQGRSVRVPADSRGKQKAARERLPQIIGVQAGIGSEG